MRILIVSQYFWPESFKITEVARSLREAGAEVTVLTGQPNYPEGKVYPGYRGFSVRREAHPDGYTIFRAPLVPRGRGGAFRLAANYLSFVVTASLFGPWLLRGRKFDVVFVYAVSPILQGVPAALIRWIKRAALVIWVQDLWPQSLAVTGYVRKGWLLGIAGAVTRWIYRRATMILVQSRAFIDIVKAQAGRVPVAYHPNPGDPDTPAAAQTQPAYTLPPGFNVVWAGNIGIAQSPATLVEAARLLSGDPAIRFVVIGGGSRLQWLQSEMGRLGLMNMTLPGRFPPEAIPPILAQASALVATLGRDDILGRTVPSRIATYLAAGRPIVAAMEGEPARIVTESGAGLVGPAEDGAALAAAILKLRAMPQDEREAMGRAGRRYFDAHLEPAALANSLLQHFDAAVALAHPASPTSGKET